MQDLTAYMYRESNLRENNFLDILLMASQMVAIKSFRPITLLFTWVSWKTADCTINCVVLLNHKKPDISFPHESAEWYCGLCCGLR